MFRKILNHPASFPVAVAVIVGLFGALAIVTLTDSDSTSPTSVSHVDAAKGDSTFQVVEGDDGTSVAFESPVGTFDTLDEIPEEINFTEYLILLDDEVGTSMLDRQGLAYHTGYADGLNMKDDLGSGDVLLCEGGRHYCDGLYDAVRGENEANG